MDLLPTEFVLAPDGTMFVNTESLNQSQHGDRRTFRGYSLTPDEVRGLLSKPLEALSGVALGCDGRVYADENHIVPAKRKGRQCFVGVSLSMSERNLAVEELTRMALNITIAVLNSKEGAPTRSSHQEEEE